MKNLLIALLFVSINALAQDQETRTLSSFSELSASEAISVFLKQGNKEEARVEVSGTDVDEVVTDVIGDKLKIEMRGSRSYRNVKVAVYVTYKSIDEVEASSASTVEFSSVVEAKSLDIDVSSAARVRAEVNVEDLDIDISSSGDVELAGSANSQRIDISSAGDYDGRDLVSDFAEVDVSSAGSAKVNVTEEIRAEASSGGSVLFMGEPKKVYADSNSGGKVRKY